jgi:hypothetical protein
VGELQIGGIKLALGQYSYVPGNYFNQNFCTGAEMKRSQIFTTGFSMCGSDEKFRLFVSQQN